MRNGRISKDKQRESEYTQNLGDAIYERYHLDNLVLSSHLVAFAAFNLLKLQNKKLDLFGLLRLPTEDYVFERSQLSQIITHLLSELRNMEQEGQIKLSDILKEADPEQVIADGLKHLGTFHVKKPLKYNRKKEIISESFRLLYFYHNRLENYDLDKKIKISSGKMKIPEVPLEE
jgi:glycerol-3-phosphate O-acyltransferase